VEPKPTIRCAGCGDYKPAMYLKPGSHVPEGWDAFQPLMGWARLALRNGEGYAYSCSKDCSLKLLRKMGFNVS